MFINRNDTVQGILLISGMGFLKRLAFYENKTETDLMHDASSAMRTNNQVLLKQIDSSLQYYGNKQRLISPLRAFIPRPSKLNFDYAEYISRVFTNLLLKVTEMPFMALIVATAVAVMLRPLLDITGRAYIIIMCLLAFYILLTSLFIKWTVRRLTHQLTPRPYKIRTHLIGKLQNDAPTGEDDMSAFSAPIDQYPLLGPPTFLDSALANRYERLFWFNRPKGFLRAVQTVLFFHAVAISLYIRSFISFEAESLWFSHGLWAYPLSIGVVLVSLSLWPNILWELGFIISCDVNADMDLVKQVEDQIDLKEHKRDIQLLTYLMHRAIYRLGQQGDISADIDIAYRDFEELPDEDKDTLQGVFTVLSESGTIHGGLTLDGLTQAAGVLGLVSDEKNFMLAERFDLVHRNDSGRIDFKEFVYITMLSSRNGWLYKAENSTRLQVIEQVQSLFRYCDVRRGRERHTARSGRRGNRRGARSDAGGNNAAGYSERNADVHSSSIGQGINGARREGEQN